MEQGIQYAGEFSIKQLTIHTSAGRVFDFKSDKVIGIELYEDLFSTSMSGNLVLLDIDNISENGPIIGQEFLTLKISTPSLEDNDLSFTFNIHKVGTKTEANKNVQLLVLNFITPELLRNNRTRVSKSYTDTISNIVKDVLKDTRYINTKKKLFIEPTSGIRKVVSPNYHPYRFITNLTSESINSKGSQNYMFFENSRGIHFKTLDSISETDTIFNYSMGDVGMINGKTVDIGKDFERPLAMTIVSNNDMLLNTMSGMLGSKIIKYNMYNKTYETTRYGYFADFELNKTIDSNPVYNDNFIDEFQNTIGSFSDAKMYLQPVTSDGKHDIQHTNEINSYSYTPIGISNNLLQRRAKITEINSGINVSLKVNGNTIIAVGETINISFPVVGRPHDSGEFDKYYSGKYIITTLKHQFDIANRRHTIEMSAAKDSISTKLPNDAESLEPFNGSGEVVEVG
jgi:hypothetical protein